MTVQGLVLAVAIGAGAIALWLDLRLASKAPRTFRSVLAHLGLSFCAFNLAPVLLRTLVDDTSPLSKMVGLFAVVLPLLTYAFLSSIWLIKQFHSALRLR
jgi:hypothetical protein